MSNRPVLLSPSALEDRFPYRRVWRTALLEIGGLTGIAGALLLVARFSHSHPSDAVQATIDLALAIAPLILWLLFSYRGERSARRPRPRLPWIVFLTALLANAIGIPLTDQVFAVSDWLPSASFFTRLLGYTLIVGMTIEFLQFAVLRFVAWDELLKTRQDGIAYSLATALGYTTALNVHFVLSQTVISSVAAAQFAETAISQMAIAVMIGYTLAGLKIGRLPAFTLPVSLGTAALLQGLFIVARDGIITTAFSPTSAGSQPALGIVVALSLMAVLFAIIGFLIRAADFRDRRSPAFERQQL